MVSGTFVKWGVNPQQKEGNRKVSEAETKRILGGRSRNIRRSRGVGWSVGGRTGLTLEKVPSLIPRKCVFFTGFGSRFNLT